METRKRKAAAALKVEEGKLVLTDIDTIPQSAIQEKYPIGKYLFCYTTGPFLLPEKSGSLDWCLLNNDSTKQKARVTIFKCPVGTIKMPVPPGPLVVNLEPGTSTHNANTYPIGYAYEVQVECNSQLVFPYVSVWPAHMGYAISGTGINSGVFLRLMP